MKLSLSYKTRPARGETENGDAVVIREEEGRSLIAVVDALGHGPKAAKVAALTTEHLKSFDLRRGVLKLVETVDRGLRGTRGAAAMMCIIDEDGLVGCGVGNVEMRVEGQQVPVQLTPGILGAGVRNCRVFNGKLRVGTRLVVFSDGLSARTSLDGLRNASPQAACEALFEKYRRNHDDASIVIADVEG